MNLGRRVYGRTPRLVHGLPLPAIVHVGLWAGERSLLSLDLDLDPADARALAAELLAAAAVAEGSEATPAGGGSLPGSQEGGTAGGVPVGDSLSHGGQDSTTERCGEVPENRGGSGEVADGR